MSYHHAHGSARLVAREGWAGLGDARIVAREGYAGLGVTADEVKRFGADLFDKARDLYDALQQQKGREAAYRDIAAQRARSSGATSIAVPVAVAGTALVCWWLWRRRRAPGLPLPTQP